MECGRHRQGDPDRGAAAMAACWRRSCPGTRFAQLTREDAYAIAAFLKSLPPVPNKVPGPFGPTETPTSFVFKVLAPSPPSK